MTYQPQHHKTLNLKPKSLNNEPQAPDYDEVVMARDSLTLAKLALAVDASSTPRRSAKMGASCTKGLKLRVEDGWVHGLMMDLGFRVWDLW